MISSKKKSHVGLPKQMPIPELTAYLDFRRFMTLTLAEPMKCSRRSGRATKYCSFLSLYQDDQEILETPKSARIKYIGSPEYEVSSATPSNQKDLESRQSQPCSAQEGFRRLLVPCSLQAIQ